MKTHSASVSNRGFTLMELMVAMTITTIIVTVLVSITSVALDTWNRSRSELRAARQAKTLIDTMARDFESLVTRSANSNQWLSAVVDPNLTTLGDSIKSSNASELIFFSAVTDRYDGNVGNVTANLGGDVSCVGYRLKYKDPVYNEDDEAVHFETFVLNRLLVNPNEAFEKLLGKADLQAAFNTDFSDKLNESQNFVCENIFQFSLTFFVRVEKIINIAGVAVRRSYSVPLNLPSSIDTPFNEISLTGNGFVLRQKGKTPPILATDDIVIPKTGESPAITYSDIQASRLTAVQISITVISDFGIDQLRTRTFEDDDAKSEFLKKHSYQYSKVVQLPSM